MPVIPVDNRASVQGELIQAPRASGLDANAFGAGLAAGLEKTGQAATLIGDQMNKAAVTEALAKYNASITNRLYDGKEGVMGKVEKDALDYAPKTVAALEKDRADIEASLGNDAQKAAFRALSMERHATASKTVDQHILTQQRAWEKTSGNAFIQTEIDDAVRNLDNPDVQERATRSILATVQSFHPGVNAEHPVIKDEVQTHMTKLRGGVLAQLITDKRYPEAEKYLAMHKGEIDTAVAAKLDEVLKPRALAAEVDTKSQAILAEVLKDKDENFVPDLEDLNARARAAYPNPADKEKRDALVSALGTAQSIREKGITDRTINNSAAIWKYINKNGPNLNGVLAQPEWASLPEVEKQRFLQHIDNEKWTAIGRAYTLENRRKGNAEERKQAINASREDAFYRMVADDDYKFAKVSDNEFLGYLGQVGPQRFHELGRMREALRSPEAVATMKLDDLEIKTALRDMGYNPDSGKAKDKAQFQRIKGDLVTRLLDIQAEKGVALSRKEKRELIRGLTTTVQVYEPNWLGGRWANRAMLDVDPSQYNAIRVPTRTFNDIRSRYRAAGVPARQITHDMIRNAYVKLLGGK